MSRILRPKTLQELAAILSSTSAKDRSFIAGGTDWIIKNRGKKSEDTLLIDLSLAEGLKGIRLSQDMLVIDAMETMTSAGSNSLVKDHASALADAASVMGSLQIRNMATVGGNLANASPAADTPSALAALGASVVIFSPRGERTASVEDVLTGPNRNSLAEDEVIKEFYIPLRTGNISAFKKIGSRTEVSIARLNMAVSATCINGIFSEARVYVGTLGIAAKRCEAAEAALGQVPEKREKALKEALASFAEAAIPGRPTLPYKKSAIQALGEDILAALAERASGGHSI